jgi:YbbR domain-containing protein
MTVVRFLVYNWPLKLLALGLSIILYAGMVILQGTQPWPGQVPIEPINQPAGSYMVMPETLPQVGDIRYVASPDVRLTASMLHATIDLKDAKVSESETSLVKIELVADDSRVQIIDYQPRQIRVKLDPIVTRSVEVRVTYGAPPSGLAPGTPVPSVSEVNVTGAASYVKRVAYADARVSIDPSGLDVNRDVELVARDASDVEVQNVEFSPRSVHVQIPVGSQTRTVTVPVHPVTTGTPAAGYYVASIEVNPAEVSVRGEADDLAKLGGLADTVPISIAGATADISRDVSLHLPAGVQAPQTTTVHVVIRFQSPNSSRSVTVGVVPEGARSDRLYVLSVPNVIVTIGGANAALDAFDSSSLVATVAVGGLDLGSHTLKVSVSLPSGIKLLAISPAEITVEVLVALPSTPLPGPS